jgi:flavorubredoxin
VVSSSLHHLSKTYSPKEIEVTISEIYDGVYRISGYNETFGITFNQFLISDEKPMLIHTGPVDMFKKIEEKVKEVIPLHRLTYVAFLHFESDEWGGMAFLDSADALSLVPLMVYQY